MEADVMKSVILVLVQKCSDGSNEQMNQYHRLESGVGVEEGVTRVTAWSLLAKVLPVDGPYFFIIDYVS
jgi:hypothetical protein